MNYIKHLTTFYSQIDDSLKLGPAHISLYMALFQFWNKNRFKNPVRITRSEVMKLSRIGSVSTYHRCITDLDRMGLISYHPSYNPLLGSKVIITEFEKRTDTGLDTCSQSCSETISKKEHSCSATISKTEQAMEPFINSINYTNNKQAFGVVLTPPNTNLDEESTKVVNPKEIRFANHKKYASCAGVNVPPQKLEITSFFSEKNASPEEAEKFFNHYESNGWKVGGKSPMKNWHAAARNWLLNTKKFDKDLANETRQNRLSATTNKSYQEKL